MEESDFGLYDDLDDALIEPLSNDIAKQRAQDEEKLSVEKKLREELELLRKENEELKASKDQVLLNWSSFSITARAEVVRKDNRITELQRELDSVVFRRNKIHKTKTFDFGTQTESPNREAPSDRSKSDKNRSRESSHVSAEKVRISHESKSSSFDKKRDSRKHEDRSSSKHREVKDDRRNSSRKSSSEKSHKSDKDSKKKDDKKSRKREMSRSPTKRNAVDAKRHKYEKNEPNGKRRSKDKEDLRKVLLMKRTSKNSEEIRKETETKKVHTAEKSDLITSDKTNMVCISLSDSDDVSIVNKCDEKQTSSMTVSLVEEINSNVVEEINSNVVEEINSNVVEEPKSGDKSVVLETEKQSQDPQSNSKTLAEKNSTLGAAQLVENSFSEEVKENEIESVQSTISETFAEKNEVQVQAFEEVKKTNDESTVYLLVLQTEVDAYESLEVLSDSTHEIVVEETCQETLCDEFQPKPNEPTESLSISDNVSLEVDQNTLQLQTEIEAPPTIFKEMENPNIVLQNDSEVKTIVKVAEEFSELMSSSCASESLDSSGSKENSLNLSQQNRKEHKGKRLSYTKDVLDDGETVVLTMSRPTRGKKKKSKEKT